MDGAPLWLRVSAKIPAAPARIAGIAVTVRSRAAHVECVNGEMPLVGNL